MSPVGDLPVELRFCCFVVWPKRADLLTLVAVDTVQVTFFAPETIAMLLFDTDNEAEAETEAAIDGT